VGRVETIQTAAGEALPMRRHKHAMAVAGVGLVGDRYATANGYWSDDYKVSRDLTLVEVEVAEETSASLGFQLSAHDLRRNLIVRGVRLNDLVGVRFRIGEVIVEGTSLCEPCAHLASLTGKPLLRPLVHRGGLRANILVGGEIREGDRVRLGAAHVGVAAVVRRDGRYLLGRRMGLRGHGTWSTPGGSPQAAESVLACAVRELAEETNLTGANPRVIGQSSDDLEDGRWWSVYVAVDVPPAVEPEFLEPAKAEAWGWFEPSHLPAPLFTPIRRLMSARVAGTAWRVAPGAEAT
jgi:ADP-ribose pyrophosphatase YjhB (NUDIX family)